MEAIERENEKMDGVLPKEVYGQLVPEEEPELLSNIMRIFMDIPENISVDLFGEIYEFFLGEFALQEGLKEWKAFPSLQPASRSSATPSPRGTTPKTR